MKVSDFIDILGEYLQEDYTTSPIWTKDEMLKYIRQGVKVFSGLTGLVDKNEIRLINATSGEIDMPGDFNELYFIQHEKSSVDVVELQDLDFVSGTWSANGTGSPMAVSVIGSGDNAVAKYVPVPSSVWDGGSSISVTPGLRLDSGVNLWDVTATNGVIVTTSVGGGATTAPVIAGPSTYWDLTITLAGVLETSSSASTTADNIALLDSTSTSLAWLLFCTDSGDLYTTLMMTNYGIATGAIVDNAFLQDFDSEYGIIVDAYAQGSATSPDYVVRLDDVLGVSLFARTTDETGMVWYKGSLRDVNNVLSDLWINPVYVPILAHGVLGLAFGHDGDGRDLAKAKLLNAIFTMECATIKESFKRRWA